MHSRATPLEKLEIELIPRRHSLRIHQQRDLVGWQQPPHYGPVHLLAMLPQEPQLIVAENVLQLLGVGGQFEGRGRGVGHRGGIDQAAPNHIPPGHRTERQRDHQQGE
jgi:hypothetical protein